MRFDDDKLLTAIELYVERNNEFHSEVKRMMKEKQAPKGFKRSFRYLYSTELDCIGRVKRSELSRNSHLECLIVYRG